MRFEGDAGRRVTEEHTLAPTLVSVILRWREATAWALRSSLAPMMAPTAFNRSTLGGSELQHAQEQWRQCHDSNPGLAGTKGLS